MAVSVRARRHRLRTAVPIPDRTVSPTMSVVDVLRVPGGARLSGEVTVGGAKNSALKLMAAALLAEGRTVIENVPRITDILIMSEVLRRLGCEVHFTDVADSGDPAGRAVGHPGQVTIEVPAPPGHEADYD